MVDGNAGRWVRVAQVADADGKKGAHAPHKAGRPSGGTLASALTATPCREQRTMADEKIVVPLSVDKARARLGLPPLHSGNSADPGIVGKRGRKRAASTNDGRRPGVVAVHRTAFLYVICDDAGLVKVGISTDVKRRLSGLQSSTGRRLTIYAQEPLDTQDPFAAEAAAHRRLHRHRVRGEWFNCHPEQAFAAVRVTAFEAEDG